MKNYIQLILIILATFVAGSASAQNYIPVVFNPKVGINFSDLIPENDENITETLSHLGWNMGVDLRYGRKWTARGGIHLYYTDAGVQWNDSLQSVSDVSAYTIKIPLGVGRKIYSLEYIHLWAYVDGVLNLNVDVKENSKVLGSGNFNAPMASVRGGIALEIARFTMEGNYELGVTDLLNSTLEGRNQLVAFSVGLKF